MGIVCVIIDIMEENNSVSAFLSLFAHYNRDR